jgi:hypothetical protein
MTMLQYFKIRIIEIVFLMVLSLISFPIYSQSEESVMNEKEIKALEKEKRKAERKQEEEDQKKLTNYLLENKRFVLEANYLSGTNGSKVPVNSTINFIIVDSANAVIQLGNGTGMGYNGLGGITVDGRISKYDLSKNEGKRGTSYSLTLYIMSSLGQYDIHFWISQSGNADATISGNSYGRLTYSGNIIPISKSKNFKGSSYP